MNTTAPATIGVIELPALASFLTHAGFRVVTGDDYRSAATSIRAALESVGPFPIVVAETGWPGFRAWTEKTARETRTVAVRPSGAQGTPLTGLADDIVLPAYISQITGAAGYTLAEQFAAYALDKFAQITNSQPAAPAPVAPPVTPTPAPEPVTQPVAVPVAPAYEAPVFAPVAPAVEDPWDAQVAPVYETPVQQVPVFAPSALPVAPPVAPTPAPEPVTQPVAVPVAPAYEAPVFAVDDLSDFDDFGPAPVATSAQTGGYRTGTDIEPVDPQNWSTDDASGTYRSSTGEIPIPVDPDGFDPLTAPIHQVLAPQAPVAPIAPTPVTPPLFAVPDPIEPSVVDTPSQIFDPPAPVAPETPQFEFVPPIIEPPTALIAPPVEAPVFDAPVQIAPVAPPIAPPVEAPTPVTPVFEVSEPAAHHAQPSTIIPAPRQPGLAEVIVTWAGKGGVGKSTTSASLAQRASRAGLRVVLIDGNFGQGDLRTFLRIGNAGLPSIYQAAISGDLKQALIDPDTLNASRSPKLDPLGFAVVQAPPAHLTDPTIVTPESYMSVVEQARRISDVVVIDTQIIESVDSTGMVDRLILPLLRAGGWGVGITDLSSPGIANLLTRLKAFSAAGVPRENLMTLMNRIPRSVGFNLDGVASALNEHSVFLGAVYQDDSIPENMNRGRAVSDMAVIAPILDAALNRITGRHEFNPDASLAAAAAQELNHNIGSSKGGVFGRFRKAK